jgi:integrase
VHLDPSQPFIAFPQAKGGKFHQIPMDRTLYTTFKAYKLMVNPAPEDFVFASRQRRRGSEGDETRYPITHVQARRIIHAVCDAAGVRRAGAHEFRRSLATHLLSNGTNFALVSKGILNHKNPQTTLKHYTGRDHDAVAQALSNLY